MGGRDSRSCLFCECVGGVFVGLFGECVVFVCGGPT